MQYLDFEIEVRTYDESQYAIAVRSAAGEARNTLSFPLSDTVLATHCQALAAAVKQSMGPRRGPPILEEAAIRSFGQQLFLFLLSGDGLGLYRTCMQLAHGQGKGLRVKLNIAPPALVALPWELLYDPARRDYLCLDPNTPLVRYTELPLVIEPLPVTPPLRILGICIDAIDLPRLDVAGEQSRMNAALQALQTLALVELIWLKGQTVEDLQRALRHGRWHVLHFIGHGTFDRVREEGLVMLADDEGKAAPLGATALARLLAHQRSSLRLVLLNACDGAQGSRHDSFSSTAATLASRGIPAVVAMQYAISDQAAVQFGRTFYEALVDNLPIDTAVTEARNAITLHSAHSLEWITPVLYLRAPTGQLFDLTQVPVIPAPLLHATDAYVLTIFSEDPEYPALIKAAVFRYFQQAGIQSAQGGPLVMVEDFAQRTWKRQLDLFLQHLSACAHTYPKLHLVCATPWLWAFALGTRIGNALNLAVYHFDGGQIFPVWAGTPSVQTHLHTPGFRFTHGTLVEVVKGEKLDRVALIVAIGRDESAAIIEELAREQPGTPIWCYKNERTRDNHTTALWLQSAAELAHAIEQVGMAGKRTVYLLGSAPAALAWMAGSAVKRFRPLHLFQFTTQTPRYRKLMELPLDGS